MNHVILPGANQSHEAWDHQGTDRGHGAQVNHAPSHALELVNEIGVLEVGKVNAPARGALTGHQDVQMTLCPTAVEGGDDVQHPADDKNLFAHRQRSPPAARPFTQMLR